MAKRNHLEVIEYLVEIKCRSVKSDIHKTTRFYTFTEEQIQELMSHVDAINALPGTGSLNAKAKAHVFFNTRLIEDVEIVRVTKEMTYLKTVEMEYNEGKWKENV